MLFAFQVAESQWYAASTSWGEQSPTELAASQLCFKPSLEEAFSVINLLTRHEGQLPLWVFVGLESAHLALVDNKWKVS